MNDNENPTISCPADITVSNDAGVCGAVVSFADATASDNCPGVTVAQSGGLTSGSVFPVGTTAVTYTATDAAGLTASCSFNVTVNDTEAPVISCPADISVSNDAGVCGAVVSFADATASDNCPGVTVAQSGGLTSGSVFPVGTTAVTYTATDAAGLTASCSFNVTVNDTEAPVISCPADISVSNDAGVCGAVVSFADATASDNCPGVSVAQSGGLTSGSVFPVGTTVVTYTATDAAGLTASCSFNVTVVDDEVPVISCPSDIIVSVDPGQCAAVVSFSASGSDNCPGQTVTYSQDPGTSFLVGTTSVTATVTDAAGNSASCSFNVTVVDDEVPVISCPSDIIVSVDPGQCAAVVSFSASGSDNCPGQTVTYSQDPGTSFPVGTTSVTATVTDVAGNSASCSFNVTVVDDEVPTAACSDLTVQLDASGNVSITSSQIDNGSSDACGVSSIDISPSSFDCSNVGVNTVTLTVTDVNGNTSTCSATVTVQDNIAPDVNCQDITVELDENGSASISASDIDGGTNDACGIASLSLSQNHFDCNNLGANMVTLGATDTNGNSESCGAIVTVEDNILPEVSCSFNNGRIEFTASDNCEIASIEAVIEIPCATIPVDNHQEIDIECDDDDDDDDCEWEWEYDDGELELEIGSNDITLVVTATDTYGNVSTCTLDLCEFGDSDDDDGHENPVCYEVTTWNIVHKFAGRAYRIGWCYYAVGSGDFLGYWSSYRTLSTYDWETYHLGSCPEVFVSEDTPIHQEDLSEYNFSNLVPDEVKYHPNPTSGEVNISYTSSETEETTIEIYNSTGQRVADVYNGMLEKGTEIRSTVHLDALQNGVYLIRVSNPRNVSIEKLILAR